VHWILVLAQDFDGVYTITIDQDPPFSIRVKLHCGFESQTIEITSNNQTVDVSLAKVAHSMKLISASQTPPERIFEIASNS
jgi:hypothetical protein